MDAHLSVFADDSFQFGVVYGVRAREGQRRAQREALGDAVHDHMHLAHTPLLAAVTHTHRTTMCLVANRTVGTIERTAPITGRGRTLSALTPERTK
jgi:hypothetical protein